jgi:hypothetical protein
MQGGLPVGTSEKDLKHAPEALSRPSLHGSSAPGIDYNIFDAVRVANERVDTAKPLRTISWWWLALPLLVALAWAGFSRFERPVVVNHAPVAVAQPVYTPSPPPAVTLAAVADGSHVEVSSDPFQSVETPAAATDSAEPQPDAKSPVAEPPPKKRASSASQDASKVSKAPASTGKTKPQAREQTNPPVKPTPKSGVAQSGRDPDVDLLNALVRHIETDAPARALPQTPTVPRSAQTIAELVESCNVKDPVEALMCQRRVCVGSWGKAWACPKERAPQPAKAAAPL